MSSDSLAPFGRPGATTLALSIAIVLRNLAAYSFAINPACGTL